MKVQIISLAILGSAVLGILHFRPQNASEETGGTAPLPEPPIAPVVQPNLDIRSALPSRPEPLSEPMITVQVPPKTKAVPSAEAIAKAEAAKKQREMRFWQQHLRNFDRQLTRFDQEKNKTNRNNLIQSIARYVQVDTMSTIEWAMGLEDPDERQAAMTAINKNALSGIGARIELDQRGLPKIRETTVLSAIDSTGLVEPGDYISGVMNSDGTVVQFNGLSLQQVVKTLRGKPGTETHLMMERISPDGVPYQFDVTVQRSMLVVQPPF